MWEYLIKNRTKQNMEIAELRWAWQSKTQSQGERNFGLSADLLNQSTMLFLFWTHRDNWISGRSSSFAQEKRSSVRFSYFFQDRLFGFFLWCVFSVDMCGKNLQGSLFLRAITAGALSFLQTILMLDTLSSWNRAMSQQHPCFRPVHGR